MTMPDRHDPTVPTPPRTRSARWSEGAEPHPIVGRVGTMPDPVSLFAVPIGRTTSRPGDPVPVTQTLYRTSDHRYVIRTCLHDGADPAQDACDVMVYADEAALREALSAGNDGLDQALLAAAGLAPDRA
ncbi:hypothetical protein LRS73_10635 [Methylobacterium currus]|uniref:hypothetical protein n=1 Tax=Methylobacterium currus TaxID=2051553 RepID=UPI001E406A21|nr:hypothetical protein [Methylobacterium currus]UHC18255.1 hypothetical protein LRS73_10635 [Methylobacterium currus]